jgi:hypothetical protein
MTKREFIIKHVAYEKGMIQAWKHIRNACNSCIRAHKKELKTDGLAQLVQMNRHLWKEGK